MSEETETALRYRKHAEELRAIAASALDPKTQTVLLSIACDYEHMAESMDAIDRTNRGLLTKLAM
jgi:hypothetical protein